MTVCSTQAHRADNNADRYRRVFFYVIYSMGLRLGEGLGMEIGDIDSNQRRIHVRQGKGGKDRYVPLPDPTLQHLRRFWRTHRHPRLLFPNASGNEASARTASSPMDRGGVKAAPCLRHPSLGTGGGFALNPGGAGPSEAGNNRPVCPSHRGEPPTGQRAN